MGRTRTAEKNKKIAKAVKKGTAIVSKDTDGRRKVSMLNVDEKKVRRSFLGTRIFYNCPNCGEKLEFKKKLHSGLCMRCGQALDWADFDNVSCVYLLMHDADEAAYWADQYESAVGGLYGIDYDEWRLSMTKKGYPLTLYFPFANSKDYGRFMRKASKEATVVKEI